MTGRFPAFCLVDGQQMQVQGGGQADRLAQPFSAKAA